MVSAVMRFLRYRVQSTTELGRRIMRPGRRAGLSALRARAHCRPSRYATGRWTDIGGCQVERKRRAPSAANQQYSQDQQARTRQSRQAQRMNGDTQHAKVIEGE